MQFENLPSIARLCQHSFIGSLLDSNSVVVDLGANRGDFARQIANKWVCTVYAVEPVPSLFNQIREDANIRKFNFAISSRDGELLINLPVNRCPSTRRSAEDRDITVMRVRGVTLETFLRDNEIRVVDLLKIDIEGSELELLQTIDPDSLAAVGQITIEFHDFIFPDSHMAIERIKREIITNGFYCIPFSRDNTDVLFVNRRLVNFWVYLYLKLGVRNYKGLLRIIARRLSESSENQESSHERDGSAAR